jgi:hypothetical protein
MSEDRFPVVCERRVKPDVVRPPDDQPDPAPVFSGEARRDGSEPFRVCFAVGCGGKNGHQVTLMFARRPRARPLRAVQVELLKMNTPDGQVIRIDRQTSHETRPTGRHRAIVADRGSPAGCRIRALQG